MKKTIVTTILLSALAVPTGMFAQGVILADNTQNTGVQGANGGTAANPVYSTLVTSNGLVFTLDPTAQYGSQSGNPGPAGNQALYVDSGFILVGGTTAAAVMSPTNNVVLNWSGANAVGDNVNYGLLTGNTGNPNPVPGTTLAGTYFFNMFIWEGTTATSLPTPGTAYEGSTGPFQNAAGGPAASGPAAPPTFLVSMPDVLLTIPEPSVFALSSIGAAALMLIRRKK